MRRKNELQIIVSLFLEYVCIVIPIFCGIISRSVIAMTGGKMKREHDDAAILKIKKTETIQSTSNKLAAISHSDKAGRPVTAPNALLWPWISTISNAWCE